jgi:hypothetical protein
MTPMEFSARKLSIVTQGSACTTAGSGNVTDLSPGRFTSVADRANGDARIRNLTVANKLLGLCFPHI